MCGWYHRTANEAAAVLVQWRAVRLSSPMMQEATVIEPGDAMKWLSLDGRCPGDHIQLAAEPKPLPLDDTCSGLHNRGSASPI